MHRIPIVVPRLMDGGKPESLEDWIKTNTEPVRWFLENASAVRAAMQPAVRLVVIHYHSKPDRAGNVYWAFRCIEPATGGMAEGRHGGGDSNLQQALWRMADDTSPGSKVLRIPKELGIREFASLIDEPEFGYAGTSGQQILDYIATRMPEGFLERFRA